VSTSAATATDSTKTAAGIINVCATATATTPVQHFTSDITGSTSAATVGTGHFSVHIVGCIAWGASATTTTTHVIVTSVIIISNTASAWKTLSSYAGAAW
jgi:hypothetical protein